MTDSGGLPPMPDRRSGRPRPPRAPVDRGGARNAPQPWSRFRVPKTPAGEGPPLEWDYGSIKRQIAAFGITLGVLVVFLSLYGFLQGRGAFDWASSTGMWIGILAFSVLYSFSVYIFSVAAGADWLAQRKNFIKTYELTSIKMGNTPGDYDLELYDKEGRHVTIKESTLAGNPDLWDLVYNGIRHSVANGAHIDPDAAHKLRLQQEVALRDTAQPDQSTETE